MIYFIRRDCEESESKLLHKNRLRSLTDDVLKKAFSAYGIYYNKNVLSYNKYGKPFLKNHPEIHYNISHCHQLAVCTIGNSELGIDAEDIRKYSPRVVKRVFSDKEAEILENSQNRNETFFRIWTLKESFVKAIGIGISYPLKSCEFLVNETGFKVSGCDGYHFSQIVLNDSFVCSLCIKSDAVKENQFYKISRKDNFFCLEL